jgi:hypothetical protein
MTDRSPSGLKVTLTAILVVLLGVAGSAWWVAEWLEKAPTAASGGLYFFGNPAIDVPAFAQADPRWGADNLAATEGTLAGEGCAVASAAMTLAAHGMDVDPGRLNAFLTRTPGGYTPQGWIYWEKAVEFDPGFADRLLPHYEDLPSHFLIDWNLMQRNPVIARLRYPNGITHFVVICGKQGFDYLIRDPGHAHDRGVYPLKDFGSPIEAIRFYKNP